MHMEHKKSNSLSKLLASDQPVHKMMMAQLLLSVSIFSFLFSYYTFMCSSSPFYSRKFNYFSANSFQLPTAGHALMNKNYIFLICNGLLVFLAKTSGLVPSSSGSFDLNDMLQKKIGDGLLTYYNISNETKEVNKEVFETKEVEKRVINEEEGSEMLNEEPPKEVSIFIAESDEEQGAGAAAASSHLFQHIEEEEEKEEVVLLSAQDQEVEEEEEEELLSTEELNHKFEEFIRKMKEEIMINEARDRQLVIVK